jgi:hypothetical protein
MSDDANKRLEELAELDRQIAIRRTSLATGVPVGVLDSATTEEEAKALAEKALAWKAAGSPAPPTAPPPTAPQRYLPNQLRREALAQMTPQQVSAAHRLGQLEGLGAPSPAPRKTGERLGHNR